ncbi:MAG: glycerophosphodiester phosphodiesterase [Methanotrichaceae archaeon]|nr:glycerophosphodiester phosphodiesterase [Methanotrichaceae archaeon]
MAVLIGHRGARAHFPENTLKSIRAAAQCRADMVEVDVRLSKDGVLVLMHDETVDRTTNGQGRVEELSLDEMQSLDCGGERVPTLSEAAALTEELGLGLVVEMKEEGLEALVAKELEGRRGEFLVTSFFHYSLREIKDLADLKTGIIISSLPIEPVELALWARADAIFAGRTNPRLFKEAHRRGIAVYPWTVNSTKEAAWLLRIGADGLVTDDPCLLREVIDQPIKDTSERNCEYYPCHHFEGQVCTHCFCPLYPCKDQELGRFVITKRGKRVWSCIDCKLVHKPEVAKYLTEHPDATTSELKDLDRG